MIVVLWVISVTILTVRVAFVISLLGSGACLLTLYPEELRTNYTILSTKLTMSKIIWLTLRTCKLLPAMIIQIDYILSCSSVWDTPKRSGLYIMHMSSRTRPKIEEEKVPLKAHQSGSSAHLDSILRKSR